MSAAPKMTPWFEPGARPFRIGVYQVQDVKAWLKYPNQGYQHWNGTFWGLFNFSPEGAKLDAESKSRYQRTYWRGLAEKP